MLPDPLSITISSSAVSFRRISSVGDQTVYRSADDQYTLTIWRSLDSNIQVGQTIYQLSKRTDDTTWPDGYNPQYISTLGGVGVNAFRLDESSRAALKAAANDFETTYGSRLVAGEI